MNWQPNGSSIECFGVPIVVAPLRGRTRTLPSLDSTALPANAANWYPDAQGTQQSIAQGVRRMLKTMGIGLVLTLAIGAASVTEAAVQTKTIKYSEGGV